MLVRKVNETAQTEKEYIRLSLTL